MVLTRDLRVPELDERVKFDDREKDLVADYEEDEEGSSGVEVEVHKPAAVQFPRDVKRPMEYERNVQDVLFHILTW